MKTVDDKTSGGTCSATEMGATATTCILRTLIIIIILDYDNNFN